MLSFETDQNQVEHIDGMTIEFPYCMHQRDLTDFIVPWHWHEELELGYIEKGTSVIRTLTQEYTVHQGDGFFINTNVVDTKQNGTPGKTTIEVNHIFYPILIGGHFGSLITSKYLNPILHNQNITVHIIRRGTKETDTILNNLVLLKDINIKKNQEIATSALVSTRKVNRVFQEIIRQTPFEYLMHYRLNQARKLLEKSDFSITDISYRCGFTDSTYMGKQFRKVYGKTPMEYRRNAQ